MKLIATPTIKNLIVLITVTAFSLLYNSLPAQMCSNPGNRVHGINAAGDIFPLTVSTATVASAIRRAYSGNAPGQAKGLVLPVTLQHFCSSLKDNYKPINNLGLYVDVGENGK